jgi:two-component system chemotaxis sensor kinase CheA
MSAVLPITPSIADSKNPKKSKASTKLGGQFTFGKYREIIFAVALFLLFDLGVLVLNFYTSFQIAEDALGINLAGRQRMLSQRTAKALVAVDQARARGRSTTAELEELQGAVKLFDVSLKGFQGGATVPGGDGKPVFLKAADGPRSADILQRAQALWTPYVEKLAPVLAGAANDEQLQEASDYARANNLKLLALMNDLTTTLEAVASDRANTLRLVQTVGIALALLNFAFILFKFLRRLRTSDAAVEAANDENREILVSVREGLFLLTPSFHIGTQLSKSAHALFGQRLQPGDNLLTLLAPLLSEKAMTDARDYIELLFSPHVKEALVQGINPLAEVEVIVKNRFGQDALRHLSFHFNRVMEEGAVRHLLVTVQDISARIGLETKLHDERLRSQKEFAMLLRAFDADPALLRQFVAQAERGLLAVNDLLRSAGASQGEAVLLKTLDEASRKVHAIKGEAGMLGLDTLADQAHTFESDLQRIRDAGSSPVELGNALLQLPLPLEDLLQKVSALKGLTGMQRPAAGQPSTEAINEALAGLAQQVAAATGKQVIPHVQMHSHSDLAREPRDLVREMTVQLVRNAITHGIESPPTRRASGKLPEGALSVTLEREQSEWTLTVRDDGAGLSAPTIRQKLLRKGWYTAEQLASFDDKQIVAHIFKPGFSTADSVTAHAGRGVGLDLVQANVQRLGARMTLRSTPGQFTEFCIRFSV